MTTMIQILTWTISACLMLALPSVLSAAVLESWQFNDPLGTELTSLTNDISSATWSPDASNATTDGVGALAYSQGADATDNIFRTATLTNKDQASGIFELEFSILAADLSGGDTAGANVGFGLRDESGNDLFLVRLHKGSNKLKLQTRIGSTNTNLNTFGTNILGGSEQPLLVRAVADLDTDLLDVFWTIGAGAEQSSLDIAINDFEFDQVRMVANTNITDWGASDSVTVDYLTVSSVVGGGSGDVVLEVNTTNGLLTIKNETGSALNMDFYEITSSISLNPAGWNSLQDQNSAGFPAGDGSGNGWEEIGLANPNTDFDNNEIVDGQDLVKWSGDFGVNGNSDADGDADTDGADFLEWQRSLGDTAAPLDSLLSEGFLTGNSLLANSDSLDLGNGFQVGAAQDLAFKVRLADGTVIEGDVQYVSGSPLTAVPEPSGFLLALMGLAFVLTGNTRRIHHG